MALVLVLRAMSFLCLTIHVGGGVTGLTPSSNDPSTRLVAVRPFWPPACVAHNPVTKCTWLGVTVLCLEPITYDTEFTAGTEGGHVWTFLVLLLFGIGALRYAKIPWEWKDSMKITCALYSAETAFFALFRIFWGLSKPLIGGAALHNLFEWSIVFHLVAETANKRQFERRMALATFWILTVISFAIMIPNLLTAFLFEQLTGIMLDFGMPLMYLSVLLDKRKPAEVKQFYMLPAIAHTLHVFLTILPLVFANFFVGHVSWYSSFWNEIFIYISAPISHLLYIAWSHTVDEIRQEEDYGFTDNESKDDYLLPPKYRFYGAKKFIGVGFLFGAFVLLGVPLLLGNCPIIVPPCVTDGPITGTSVAMVNRDYEDRFIKLVEQADLVRTARKAKGNIEYRLVQNDRSPREFRFIETWKSYESLTEWIRQDVPHKLFRKPEMVAALAGGELTNLAAYKNLHATCAYPPQPVCAAGDHCAAAVV